MFSGITQGLFKITSLKKSEGLMEYTVDLSDLLIKNLSLGASISVDGVCQSVMKISGTQVSFQAIQETLQKTTLSILKEGDLVSIERSLCWGDEVGGHEVSGHIYGTGRVQDRIAKNDNLILAILCNPDWMKYILPKGFIAIDGSSLTVGETKPKEGIFYIHLIPETLRLTHFADKKIQDPVNIEFDHKTKTMVDTIERLIHSYSR